MPTLSMFNKTLYYLYRYLFGLIGKVYVSNEVPV